VPLESIKIPSANEFFDMTSDKFLEFIKLMYRYPIGDAANILMVGTTSLKKKCRDAGLSKWPGRQFCSILKSMENDSDQTEERRKYYDNKLVSLENDPEIPLCDLLPKHSRFTHKPLAKSKLPSREIDKTIKKKRIGKKVVRGKKNLASNTADLNLVDRYTTD